MATVGFRIVGPPEPLPEGACPEGADPAPPNFGGGDVSDVLRLTYRVSGGGELVCDAVLELDQGNPVIAIPLSTADAGAFERVDAFAEYFRSAGGETELLGSGVTRGVDLRGSGVVDIRVTPSNTSTCARERASVARAFHTATPLPHGEVLLLGGAVADASGDPTVRVEDNTALLFATDTAEIYDPRAGSFREVSIPSLLPRALHRAVVLADSEAQVRIVLLGGLTVAGDPSATPVLVSADEQGRLRLVAGEGARGAPVEVLTYDVAASRFTREVLPAGTFDPARRVFGSAVDSNTPDARPLPVMLGGWSDAGMSEAVASFETLDSNSGQPVASESLRASRFGATITDLGGGSALVWGGHLNSAPGGLVDYVGEMLLGLDTSSPTTAALDLIGVVVPAPRAFHRAERAGDGSVLVTGGFLIASDGKALAPSPIFAQRLMLGAQLEVADVPVAGGGAGVPAGYLDAVPLADGDVLVAGGNPDLGYGDCSTDLLGLVCAIPDTLRYRSGSASFDRTGSLVVGRYGHALARLEDGKVLITGGLRAEAGSLRVVADAELFDPREIDDDPIADLAPAIEREPGDVARDPEGSPVAECAVVTSQ